jgi:hypothetical protein
MFTIASTKPRSTTIHALRTTFLATILSAAVATLAMAQTTVNKPVHWRASPLVNAQGVPLPPSTSYEVWLEEDGLADYLKKTVADTACVLALVPGVSYRVRVRGVSSGGVRSAFSVFSDPYRPVRPSPVTVQRGDTDNLAAPNPFTDRTVISFRVPETLAASAPLSLEIYDVRGHRLQAFELSREPGLRGVTWDGRDATGVRMPAGVYLARFRCGSASTNVKLTIIP